MRHNRDIFSIFFYMKVCFVFSLESPHRGDPNECTQIILTYHFQYKKITLNYPISAATDFFQGAQTAVVNEPSVFEPLKFYCKTTINCYKLYESHLNLEQKKSSAKTSSLYCKES